MPHADRPAPSWHAGRAATARVHRPQPEQLAAGSHTNGHNGLEDQQGKVADAEVATKVGQLQRAATISDGKKVHLTGSTTRQEKNWKSTVFGGPEYAVPKRKLLGRQSMGKEGFGFCDKNEKMYSKRDSDYNTSFKRS